MLLPGKKRQLWSGQAIQTIRLNAGNEPDRRTLSRNEIIPAPRRQLSGIEPENPVGERVTAPEIIKQPPVERFLLQCVLNLA